MYTLDHTWTRDSLVLCTWYDTGTGCRVLTSVLSLDYDSLLMSLVHDRVCKQYQSLVSLLDRVPGMILGIYSGVHYARTPCTLRVSATSKFVGVLVGASAAIKSKVETVLLFV